jgi:hypothetical protein
MAAARKLKVVKSIQAEPKRSRKSSTAVLQAKTLRKAYRQGMAWDDDEVSRLVAGIEKDETTFEMALAIGRSYYGVAGARAHVAFALRHSNAIWGS